MAATPTSRTSTSVAADIAQLRTHVASLEGTPEAQLEGNSDSNSNTAYRRSVQAQNCTTAVLRSKQLQYVERRMPVYSAGCPKIARFDECPGLTFFSG